MTCYGDLKSTSQTQPVISRYISDAGANENQG